MITLEQMGLDEATEMAAELATALSEYEGCYYRGSTREDGTRNADVVEKLKCGITFDEDFADPAKRRDLKTMSNKAAGELGEEFKTEVMKAVSSMTKKAGGFKKAYAAKPDYERAKIQAARAWRVVGKDMMFRMWSRLQKQLSADDSGAESPAPRVSPGYAAQRQAMYGVSRDRVYIATGQLMEDLQPEDGRIMLVKGLAAMGRINQAAEFASVGKAVAGAFGLTGKFK